MSYKIGDHLRVELPDNSIVIGRVHTTEPLLLQVVGQSKIITEFDIIEEVPVQQIHILCDLGKG